MTLRGKTRLKIWLVLLGTFLLGSVAGAAVDGFYRTRAADDRKPAHVRGKRKNLFEEMRRDLSLNEEQAAAVRAILDETRNEFHALEAETRPRFDAVRRKGQARIRALLTPEQQQRFDAEVARRDAEKARRHKEGH